jgi:hypothetical protein
MLERVGGQLVEAVAVDPALTIAVPAPERERITIGARAGAPLLWFLASIVTGAELFAVGISPGGEFAAVTSNIEIGKVNQAQLEGARDKAGKEDGLERALIGMKSREVAIAFEDRDQGCRRRGTGQDAINQAIDDTRVRAQVILVLVLIIFVPLVTMVARATARSPRLVLTLKKTILEVVEGADTGDILGIEAADDSIDWIVVHHLHPDVEAGDTTFHHGKARTQHRDRIAGGSTLAAGVEDAQERVCQIEVGLLQLLPDAEMAMVGAQAAIAAEPVTCKAHVLAMWEGS